MAHILYLIKQNRNIITQWVGAPHEGKLNDNDVLITFLNTIN